MDREFLDLYNRELKLLKEHAKEFAEEYPGIADRLGGLLDDRMDPLISGLLEGAAFLAARVQLKLKHEFPEFTSNLLEQLIPDFLAPVPSAAIVQVRPAFGDPALKEGRRKAAGSYLDATYLERDRLVACRYRLTSDLMIWPFDITRADYLPATAQLQTAGLPIDQTSRAALKISFTVRMAAKPEAEIPDLEALAKPETHARAVDVETLDILIRGAEDDAVALYEQIFGHRHRVFVRHLDNFGDPVVFEIDDARIEQIGMSPGEDLMPTDTRMFHGFSLLRDYFVFPRKFLGFRLGGLKSVMARLPAKSFDVFLVFDEVDQRLPAAVTRDMLALYAAPAINLFEKTTDRIIVNTRQSEYHVVADRSRPLDFEPHRVIEVFAHHAGNAEKVPVYPLYSAPRSTDPTRDKLYYSIRRLPRRRTAQERRFGAPSDYTGTEMFLSLIEPGDLDTPVEFGELSVKALCSNRHLTEALPVGDDPGEKGKLGAGSDGANRVDFRLLDDTELDLRCIAGPTRPREPIASHLKSRAETASTGSVTWRLINMLSLNHLGLLGRSAGRNAQSLREILSIFADLRDVTIERRIDGIRGLDSRPVVRRLWRETGAGMARGIEITVTLDEKSFEGSGAYLLGAVLDRFFAEYVGVNTFTQTVIRTVDRGVIMRWPVRLGTRRPM